MKRLLLVFTALSCGAFGQIEDIPGSEAIGISRQKIVDNFNLLNTGKASLSMGAALPTGCSYAAAGPVILFIRTSDNALFVCASSGWQQVAAPGGSDGSVSWGSVTGTLSNQGDLAAALAAKAPIAHSHAASDITSGVMPMSRLSSSGTCDGTAVLWGDGRCAPPTVEEYSASNQGTVGVGPYKDIQGNDIRFYKLNAASNQVAISLNGTDHIDFDLNPGNVSHQALSGAGVNTHAQIDAHIAATNNPHATTAAQVGAVPAADKGGANGVATLDASVKVPLIQIPTGQTASSVALGNDPRFTDSRTPTPHASSHGLGQADALALDAGQIVTGAFSASRIPDLSGTYAKVADKTGAGAKIASASSVPADGCATWASGNISSTGIACGSGSGGEANTASNQGTAGVGLFYQKSGVDLQFYKLNPSSNKITITLDGSNHKIDFDVATANLGLTASSVGLGNVANVDTTNAANIGSGTLTAARLPAALANSTSVNGTTIPASSTLMTTGTVLAAGQEPGHTGDVTNAAGSLTLTAGKINGTSVPTNAAADQTIVTTAAATGSWTGVPNCGDSGHALAYSTTSHTYICQAISTPPAGAAGQLQFNNSGAMGGFTVGGDGALNTGTGVLTVTKTNGASFSPSATTDATNAANISGGTLAAARLPAALANSTSVNGTTIPASSTLMTTGTALASGQEPAHTGDVTNAAGSLTLTAGKINGTSVPTNAAADQTIMTTAAATGSWTGVPNCGDSGHALAYSTTTHTYSCQAISGSAGGSGGQLQYNNGGVLSGLTVSGDGALNTGTGALTVTKTNGAAFATSATTDTTNAANISSGTLAAARLPAALANSTSVNGTTIPAASTLMTTATALAATQEPAHMGDVTNTAGSLTLTAGKINGTSVPTNAGADQTIVTSAAATGSWAAVPNCGDSSHALAYSTTTHTYSCQAITGTAGGMADPGGNGVVARTALNTTVNRTITGGTGVSVVNGDGVAGNPTITADTSVLLSQATGQIGTPWLCADTSTGSSTTHSCAGSITPAYTAASYSNRMQITLCAGSTSSAAQTLSLGTPGAKKLFGSDGASNPTVTAGRCSRYSFDTSLDAGAGAWRQDDYPSGGGSGITQLTGDVTAGPGSGLQAATVVKVNGTSVPTNSTADQALVTSASAAGAWASVPNCGDTSHGLAYSTATHAFSCQSITGSAGGVADPGANGMMARTALNTTTARTITGTANHVTITNGDGASGNPTLDLASGITTRALTFTLGDPTSSSALTTSATDYLTVPFACTVAAYNVVIDAADVTFRVKIWKVAAGTSIPTAANSLSTSGWGVPAGTAVHSTTLTDLSSTAVAANDILAVNVATANTVKYMNLVLQCNQ